MAIGFSNRFDFSPIIGWELYQVTLDKYHVMFWFEDERALLNVADSFAFRSADGALEYVYEIYGERKFLSLDRILRVRIVEYRIASKDRLDLEFENGDVLSVFDNPEFRSWWFLGGREDNPLIRRTSWALEIGDMDAEELTDDQLAFRRSTD